VQRDSSFAVKPLSSRPKTRAMRLSEAQLLPLAVVARSGKVLGKACSSCVKLACTRRVLPTRLVKPMLAAAGHRVRKAVCVLNVACGLHAKHIVKGITSVYTARLLRPLHNMTYTACMHAVHDTTIHMCLCQDVTWQASMRCTMSLKTPMLHIPEASSYV